MKEGDFCFIALETPHSISVFDDSVVLNILLKKNNFGDIDTHALCNKCVLMSFFFDSLCNGYETEYILFHTWDELNPEDLLLDMDAKQFEWNEYSDNQLTDLHDVSSAQLSDARICEDSRAAGTQEEGSFYLNQNSELSENKYRTATLSDMAEYFHLSTSYCSRQIKEFTGRIFAALLQDIRLRQAEALLFFARRVPELSRFPFMGAVKIQNPSAGRLRNSVA